ncbi:MAG: hypothetical protein HZC40_16495 [Chloroflexi bacterium]|nr:hypothetical protein [Chloroflexota bacterium]
MIHPFFSGLLQTAGILFMAASKAQPKKSRKPAAKARAKKPVRAPARKPIKRAALPAKPAKPARVKTNTRPSAPPPKKVEVKPAPPVKPQPVVAVQPKPVPPTGRAILLAPENAKFTDTMHPRFRWLSVGGATRYQVEWSDKPDLTDNYAAMSVSTEAVVPVEKPLRIGGLYYWRVRGGNEAGWGPWSSIASFRVMEETE